MSISVNFAQQLTVRELLETGVPAASRKTVSHDAFNQSGQLNASSVPPATKVAAFEKALVAGAGTIDLTALTGTNGATIDGTGLKVQGILIVNPATNANPLVIEPGGANPYNLFGAAFKITLHPGKSLHWISAKDADTPDVAAGAKNIALSDGAAGTETHKFIVVLG
jgi:hypothetical protein